jgi:hypothetical protein
MEIEKFSTLELITIEECIEFAKKFKHNPLGKKSQEDVEVLFTIIENIEIKIRKYKNTSFIKLEEGD